MRVGSLLRREGRSYTEGDDTILSLLSQPIQEFGAVVVITD